jgi:hypothetical protein
MCTLRLAEISAIIKAIKIASNNLSKNANIKTVSAALLSQNIQTAVNSSQDTNIILHNIRNLFINDYKVVGAAGVDTDVYLFNNFNRASSALTDQLNKQLDIILSTIGQDSEVEKVSSYLNYGHTAVSSGNGDSLYFNSPKLLAVIYDTINSSKGKDIQGLLAKKVDSFIETTRQIDSYVTINKEFSSGFMSVFVSIGGNVVKFENRNVNQLKGSVLETKEKAGLNKVVLAKLAEELRNTNSKLGTEIARAMTIGRSSPSMVDYVLSSISSILIGSKPTTFKQTISATKKGKEVRSKSKSESISGIAKNLGKLNTSALISKSRSSTSLNLTSLQALLDRHLQDVISANMGDGSARNVLNYRTGRFAASAKVERLSQSRQGMITAFYSYMKNPYQTFEPGYRQGSPKTRDPKLLIAGSIREIAATVVGNNLRAVSI